MARHVPRMRPHGRGRFKKARLPLYVAYYRRRMPRFLTAQELIANGALGRVTGVRYHCTAPRHKDDAGWRLRAEQSGGGHFLDIGSHALDLLDFFFGSLSEVTGLARNHGGTCLVEDAVTMSFLAGGIPGVASWNFASAEKEDAFTITGTEGRLIFSLMGNESRCQLEKSGKVEVAGTPQSCACATTIDPGRGGRPARSRGTCPSTGESARRTTQVMDTVLAGYYGGRTDEFWRRPETWSGQKKF